MNSLLPFLGNAMPIYWTPDIHINKMKNNPDIYEITIPPHEAPHFWVDKGKLYHIRDPEHPYPLYDPKIKTYYCKYKWTSSGGFEPYDQWHDQIGHYCFTVFQTILINNDPKEINEFIKFIINDRKDPSYDDHKFNLIIGTRSYDGDMLEIGYGWFEATTDWPVKI